MTTSPSAQTTPPVDAIASKIEAAARVFAEGLQAVATLSQAAGQMS